jgi:uncharacterized protein YndB with AHSA1/START domain
MGKKILIGLGVFLGIVAVFAIFVAMQPDEFAVERSATIAAPPEVVFNQVNNFHNWEAWSPWLPLDPQCQKTYEGPDSGEGAKFHWAGNDKVGEGRMQIAESIAPQRIVIDLEFIKPFAAQNVTLFTISPEPDGTKVVWNMSGKNNFMGKAMCLFMDMDKMVGGDFKKGLAAMKEVAEKEARGTPATESKPADAAQPTEPAAEPSADAAPSAEHATPANP